MKHRTLKQYIRQMYLPRLIIPIVLFVILLIVLIINPLKDHIQPFKVSELSSIDTLYESNTRNVTFTADTLYYAGVDYHMNGRTVAKIYYALEDGKCYLFLICEEDLPKDYETLTDFTVKAHLTHNDNMYEMVIASLSGELEFSETLLRNLVSHTFINQYEYVYSVETFSIYALLIFTVMVLVDIIFIVIVFFNPHISIPFFKLRKYGKMKSTYNLAEKEFNESVAVFGDNLFVTDTFFFGITRAYNMVIIPLEHIVWIYKYNEFTNRHGKSNIQCPLCIVTNRKVFIKIPHIPEEISDDIISYLQNRFPEIMVGNEKGTF